ncbi:hypothetical protein KM915_20900 [Cytobacillus oceanisediminis]|uniref:hypothetical protein n=1 Tax=Cytobacillus oceanisediminis TaxID=665099 RepID=UPI001C21F75E|nr:hypothetical protein [Cytobacillus oceanisediminis]MBU8732510.1 hypothetical protein [Cytobacillus oceanisediminis]
MSDIDKSTNSEIQQIDKTLHDLQEQKRRIQSEIRGKTNYQFRKERARRLIETGALAEKYFEIHNLSIQEREELFSTFANFIKANKPDKLKK